MKRLCTTQKKLKRLEAGSIQPAFDDKSITDWNFDACFENIEEFGCTRLNPLFSGFFC